MSAWAHAAQAVGYAAVGVVVAAVFMAIDRPASDPPLPVTLGLVLLWPLLLLAGAATGVMVGIAFLVSRGAALMRDPGRLVRWRRGP